MTTEPASTAPATSPTAEPRPVVLVHGAWHGAWCWASFQAELDRRGVPSFAIDLPGHGASTEPLGGLHDDAAALGRALDRLGELGHDDIVLVGHSYGGAVITHATSGRNDIAHLVYVAAFALDDGESVMSALGSFDRREVALGAAMVPADDGASSTLDPSKAATALYGHCGADAVAAALPRLSPQPSATMVETVAGSPRESMPSTYVMCTQDSTVHPDHQAVMAARCAMQVTIDTDHSPFLSAIGDLADVVETIARGDS